MNKPRTTIEFVDRFKGSPVHVSRDVYVNGERVLVSPDIELEFGDNEVTSVTLKFYPSEVHFVSERQFRWLKRWRTVKKVLKR